jgi:hypothetical protein
LTDYSRANKLDLKPVVFNNAEATTAAYFSGRCQAYTTDASGLASYRSKQAQNPADHVILPELISKEPLGPMVRRGDDDMFAIVKWVGFALLEAEELGYGEDDRPLLDRRGLSRYLCALHEEAGWYSEEARSEIEAANKFFNRVRDPDMKEGHVFVEDAKGRRTKHYCGSVLDK